MKLLSRTPIKVLIVILLTLSTALSLFCTACAAIGLSDPYYGTREELLRYIADLTFREDVDPQYFHNGKPISDQQQKFYEKKYDPTRTNFRFCYINGNGDVVLSNTKDDPSTFVYGRYTKLTGTAIDHHIKSFSSYEALQDYLAEIRILSPKQSWDYRDNVWWLSYDLYADSKEEYHISYGFAPDFPVHDALYLLNLTLEHAIQYPVLWVALALLFLACSILLFVLLLCGTAHHKGVDGRTLSRFQDRIPLDLYLACSAVLLLWAAPFTIATLAQYIQELHMIPFIVGIGLGCYLLSLATICTIVARAKCGKWWRNTILFRILRLVWRFARFLCRSLCGMLRRMRICPRVSLIASLLALVAIFSPFIIYHSPRTYPLYVLFWLCVIGGTVWLASQLRTVFKGAEALAAGDLTGKVDTAHLHGEIRSHAETLNSIHDGIQSAVDARMRSERMKTELITNVSHDIKTPLTSIVNYVDLLSQEEMSSENARQYLEVLQRQSARMKKLIEDLVEASKASTGNISADIAPLNVSVLLSQVEGEYRERLEQAQLETILTLPDESLNIAADGRLLWRVFDNLMNNICKYAMPATRVYLTAERMGDAVKITFRNISRAQITLSPEELTERFVRGDASRNSEGSGLGLSIARSLVELMHGTMAVQLDGDLFKVSVTFPACQECDVTAMTETA